MGGVTSLTSVQDCKTAEVTFRALLTDGGAERLELVRPYSVLQQNWTI